MQSQATYLLQLPPTGANAPQKWRRKRALGKAPHAECKGSKGSRMGSSNSNSRFALISW